LVLPCSKNEKHIRSRWRWVPAFSEKFGRAFISKIRERRTIFILWAQDQLAVEAIEKYRDLAIQNGLPMAESLQKEIEGFRKWRGPKRMPD
jgi:hypothetical protein